MKISNTTLVPFELPNGMIVAPNSHVFMRSVTWDSIKRNDLVAAWVDEGFLLVEDSPEPDPPEEEPISLDERIKVGTRFVSLDDLATVLSTGGGLKVVKVTQAEYDAIPVKDPNTLYVIP